MPPKIPASLPLKKLSKLNSPPWPVTALRSSNLFEIFFKGFSKSPLPARRPHPTPRVTSNRPNCLEPTMYSEP